MITLAMTRSIIAVLAVTLFLASVAAANLQQQNTSWWGDPAVCHDPAVQEGCEQCCDEWHGTVVPGVPPPSWIAKTWTGGNCSGCKVLPRDARACGNCFPATRGWFNNEEFKGYPGEPGKPDSCKPCSNCTVHVMELYRQNIQLMQAGGKEPPCNSSGADPAPPVGPCYPSPTCDCMCNYANQIQNYCNLDPDPENFIGPCKFDMQFNLTMDVPFDGQCDEHGYYSIVACGKVAPAPLPPNANVQPATGLVATSAGSDGKVDELAGETVATSEDGFCWCVNPASGIQNGSSATKGMNKTKPSCNDTVREGCFLLGERECSAIGAGFCDWTCYAWGCQCHPIA